MLKEKILSQISDIRDPMLFAAIQVEGHALDKHLLSDDALRRALWLKPKQQYPDDIVKVTRFSSKEDALNLIADTLVAAVEELKGGY